jgi:hypothetical protein
MANVEKLATIDPEVAEQVWNNSYLKNEYGGIDLKGLKNEWKLEISKDGNTAMKINSRTGKIEPVEMLKSADQVKQLKEGESLVMVDPKTGKVSELYKNSKPDPALSAEKAFIQAEIENGTHVDVAVKNWQQIKNSGKSSGKAGSGTGGKETALQKNYAFWKSRGKTDAETEALLEPGRLSRPKFVGGVYSAAVRSGEKAVDAQILADEAGKYYDSMGGASAPSPKVVANTGKVDAAIERAKVAAAIKARPDQAAIIKKRFQDKTGQPY